MLGGGVNHNTFTASFARRNKLLVNNVHGSDVQQRLAKREGTTLSLQFCKWYSLVSEAHCTPAGYCQLVCTTNMQSRGVNDRGGGESWGKSESRNHLLPSRPTPQHLQRRSICQTIQACDQKRLSVYSGIAVLAAVVKAVIWSRGQCSTKVAFW